MSARLFPFPADWGGEVTETEEVLTDVLPAWDGTEQRVALRSVPIRTLEYGVVVLEPPELASLQHCLSAPWSQEWSVPWWPDATALASTLAAGSTVVPVPTSGRSYVAGQQILLSDGLTSHELRTVQSVAADSVTLTAAVAATWPAGSFVLPARSGQMATDPQFSHLTDTVAELRVKFECRNQDEAPGSSSAATYLGLPVLAFLPEPGTQRDIKRLANTIDNKTGARAVDDRRPYPVPAHQLQFLGLDRAEVDSMRNFLRALNGQVNPFWLPSERADLVLHAAASAGASVIQIEPCGYADYAYADATLRDIQIQTYAGACQRLRITGATAASGYEILDLGTPLSASLAPGSCLLSRLSLCRRASDVLTLAWHSTEVATLAVDVAEIPWEVPA